MMAAPGGKTREVGEGEGEGGFDDVDLLDMSALVGSVVRVTLVDGQVVESEVFAYDSKNGVVVLQQRVPHVVRKRNMRFIKESFISKVEYKGREPRTDVSRPLPPVPYERLKQRETLAVEKAKAQLDKLGVGVSPQGQATFDFLAKTLPCKWDGTTIVMDSVRINEPYGPDNCESTTGDETALNRLRMMLSRVPRAGQ